MVDGTDEEMRQTAVSLMSIDCLMLEVGMVKWVGNKDTRRLQRERSYNNVQ